MNTRVLLLFLLSVVFAAAVMAAPAGHLPTRRDGHIAFFENCDDTDTPVATAVADGSCVDLAWNVSFAHVRTLPFAARRVLGDLLRRARRADAGPSRQGHRRLV